MQEYRNAEGRLTQWCFTGITEGSFHWLSRESADAGTTWKLTAEFFLKRREGVRVAPPGPPLPPPKEVLAT